MCRDFDIARMVSNNQLCEKFCFFNLKGARYV